MYPEYPIKQFSQTELSNGVFSPSMFSQSEATNVYQGTDQKLQEMVSDIWDENKKKRDIKMANKQRDFDIGK